MGFVVADRVNDEQLGVILHDFTVTIHGSLSVQKTEQRELAKDNSVTTRIVYRVIADVSIYARIEAKAPIRKEHFMSEVTLEETRGDLFKIVYDKLKARYQSCVDC